MEEHVLMFLGLEFGSEKPKILPGETDARTSWTGDSVPTVWSGIF